MEIVMVAAQPGNPVKIVTPERAIKIPAQINSNRREILNTLQNKKKWPTANTIAKLAGQNVLPSAIEPIIPTTSTMASRNDQRKPGANFGIGVFKVFCPSVFHTLPDI